MMSVNYVNEIISVFLDRNVNQLIDMNLSAAIEAKGTVCSPEEIRRVVQSPGSSVLQLRINKEGIFLIHIEPKISICPDFRNGRCVPKPEGCNQLHLCRFFGRCGKKDCRFPHNLQGKNNQQIVRQCHCQHIDPFLLVRLIQLHQRSSSIHPLPYQPTLYPLMSNLMDTASSSVQPKPVEQVSEQINRSQRRRRSRGVPSEITNHSENLIPSSNTNTTTLIDIGFRPISNSASNITIETIITFLRSQGLAIQNNFNPKIDQHFHRWTLQVEQNHVVDDLLNRSDVSYRGLSLKFKRTDPVVDSKSFVLKSTVDVKKGPISGENFFSYIDALVNHSLCKVTDLSTSSEQILLIECNQIIDFGALCRIQRSRRQVQGTNVSLKRIYQIETVIIESLRDSLSFRDIRNMLESVYDNVFIFTFISNQSALVEFVHADALKQWLENCDAIEQEFDVTIKPNINYTNEGRRNNTSSRSSASQSTKSKVEDKNTQVTIYIRRTWAMVVQHPTFSIEYKNYIRSQMGVEVDIRGNRIQIRPTPGSDQSGAGHPSSLLSNRTKTFMERFVFESVSLEQPVEQLAILNAHSSIVAISENRNKTYLLAATSSNMEHIMQKLRPGKLVDNKPTNRTSAAQEPNWASVIPLPLPNRPSSAKKTTGHDEDIVERMTLTINTPAQAALFAEKTVESRLQTYFNQMYHIKLNFELTTDNSSRRIVRIVGRQTSVNSALEDLLTLMTSFKTKTFKDVNDTPWLKIKDALRVIQHQLNLYDIVYVCEPSTSPLLIQIHYIDKNHTKLGVDEQFIDTLCRQQLILATCKPTVLANDWTMLTSDVLKRGDYGKDICLLDEQQIITLYGLPQIVKDIQQQFQSINQKALLKLNSIPTVTRSDSIKSENPPIQKSRTLNVDSPAKVQDTIVSQKPTETITSKPPTHSVVFDIDEPGFELLINQDSHRVLAIIDSNCSFTKQILHHPIQIPIPKAKVYELNNDASNIQLEDDVFHSSNETNTASAQPTSNWFLRLFQKNTSEKTQSPQPILQKQARVTATPTLTIGKSKIIVCTGDLTKQAVDLVVCCSTSKILCDAITSAAGAEVHNVYKRQSSNGVSELETSGGSLPCKQIIFRSWVCPTNHRQDVKQRMIVFVASIITYAIQHHLTTIAFPSIGCGQLGQDPKIIAEYMIGETYRHLKNSVHSLLEVSFVLLPGQKNVYDAFADQLKMMPKVDDTPTFIVFDKQTVRITLTGPNDYALIIYQQKIHTLAQSCSSKRHLTDNIDMADWSQTTIHKYYDYCLQKRVIPTLDIDKSILDLIGPKDAVVEAEKYYFQLTAETLRNNRIQVISRGYVWSVEISSGKWEPYTNKIIEQIENAFTNRLPSIDIVNEKNERCRLIFSSMEEHYQQQRKRKIRRTRIDSSLPNNWNLEGDKLQRVILSISSKEYIDVLDRFDLTMKNQYSKIVKIERIQNERWYKQYAVHRDDFTQRHRQPDERLLFHGCNSDSADKIIRECFNRSFAGVNGTAYGVGVYFHERAQYSHSYTRANISGERTMFLARVLVGKTCVGNQSMKVPPEGFDTTTDGQYIFVVYHDAGAYGEYLITYK